MKKLEEYKSVYFVGAGGIGMSALVRYCLSLGLRVAGYDRTSTHLTEQLQQEGAALFFDESVTLIPEYCRCPQDTLVVYTPAIPQDHEGFVYFRENGFEVIKRAKLLGLITHSLQGLCFAGTHGKTTTSSMAAHIFTQSSIGCNAFLGGILRNYDTNLLLSQNSPYAIIEADEFDRSFHQLLPYIAVITSTDADHLDIYGTEEAYLESFAHFSSLVQPGGALIIKQGVKLQARPQEGVRVYNYSKDAGDFHAENIRIGDGRIVFDFVAPDGRIDDVELGVPVEINIENAVASMAVAWLCGVDATSMRDAISTFQGAKRRFEFWLRTSQRVMIDDYAHHPDELRASISSVKALYPHRKLSVIFQPHLYTRTRDFAPQFAQALSLADEVILLNIYPARELPIEGVTSQIIYDDILSPHKELCSREKLVERIKEYNFEVLLTMGAGDIDKLLPEIYEIVRQE